jgi:hypothetical protein
MPLAIAPDTLFPFVPVCAIFIYLLNYHHLAFSQ